MVSSFKFAFNGIYNLIKNENNFKFHVLALVCVLSMGVTFSISATEWCILILCIGLVLSAEAFNTSIEKISDFVEPAYNGKIKIIKDISAAGVLITVVISVLVGFIVFLPKLLSHL